MPPSVPTATEVYVIEALDTARHHRDGFSCGVSAVENFFRPTAGKLSKAGNIRVYVMTDPTGTVVGFHALNAHSIDYADLPSPFARTRPSHGSIPAAFISMMGRDSRFRGSKLGEDLLVDALLRIERLAATIGITVVILDVLDCGDPRKVANRLPLYQSFGFEPLASSPLRLFLPIKNIRATLDSLDVPD